MPSFRVSVPHELGQAAARARVEGFVDNVRSDLPAHVSDVAGEWNNYQLNFRLVATGMQITGTLQVEERLAEVSGSMPLAAVLFRGQIERSIREELSRLLG
jgi:hypothetical protein